MFTLVMSAIRQRTRPWIRGDFSWQRVRTELHLAAHFSRRHAEIMSISIVALGMCLMLLNLVANAQVVAVSSPNVVIRSIGSAEVGRERIVAENLTTLSHLNDLAGDPDVDDTMRLVYAHSPLILWYGTHFPAPASTPMGLYFVVSQSVSGDATATTIRYYLWFTDEDGGMPIDRRLSMFGHSMDRELVYRVTLLGDEIVAAYFQAPGHRLITFDYSGESRPVFTVASSNHNFRLVTERELDFPGEKLLLAPYPRLESPWTPAHDPDFAAIAIAEVWDKYRIDLRNFVFVEFEIPTVPTAVTISVRVDNRWYYLHEQIGGGVSRPGYNQVGVNIGFPVLEGDVQEVRIVAYPPSPSGFEPIRVTIYPRDAGATG